MKHSIGTEGGKNEWIQIPHFTEKFIKVYSFKVSKGKN